MKKRRAQCAEVKVAGRRSEGRTRDAGLTQLEGEEGVARSVREDARGGQRVLEWRGAFVRTREDAGVARSVREDVRGCGSGEEHA